MTADIGNIFEAIPAEINQEIFSELVQSDKVKIQRIISKGQTSPESGWYDQAENEWVIVLKGEATILFENGDDVHLVSGSYLTIPANTKHKVTWTVPDQETIWLAVHYS
jgi:cupin 2 domain-containing protein